MHRFKHMRRHAVFAATIAATGALAGFGSAPAFADVDIWGSGAALQNQLQNDILIPNAPGSLKADITFSQTTSGGGSKEFGNSGTHAGTLEPGEDTKADPELDSYVAVDSGPTTTELENGSKASGSGSTPNEVTVPVAQTPLDILLSLPADLTLTSGTTIDLTNELLSQLFAGTVPAQTGVNAGYKENTWGAFLIDAGLTTGDFTDSGGGSTSISIEVRKEGAGTTLNLKQYLIYVDAQSKGALTEWSSINEDETACNGTDEWPTTATTEPCPAGNSTDANEVTEVWKTAGTVGYATAGDAAADFTNKAEATGDDGDQDVLYAEVQDGTTVRSKLPEYADPEANGNGKPNVYTGEVHIAGGSTPPSVGSWVVPGSWTGSWAGTRASDPTVFNDSGEKYYPIVAAAFDLSWKNFTATNLESDYSDPGGSGSTANAFLEYATASTEGQADIGTYGTKGGEDDYYYAPLPTNIQADAHKAAEEV